MNVERILRIADRIENSDSSKFHMGAWFGKIEQKDAFQDRWKIDFNEDQFTISPRYPYSVYEILDHGIKEELSCGTTACVAGWSIVDLYLTDVDAYYESCSQFNQLSDTLPFSFIQEIASSYLEITENQASRLFYCHDDSVWSEVRDEYNLNFDPDYPESWSIHPKVAVDVLRRIAKDEIIL